MEDLLSIVVKFNTQGIITEIKPLGVGLISGTYEVNVQEADAPDYVLQRINRAIFQSVEILQSDITVVTGHIRKRLTEVGEADIDRKVLSFLATKEGKIYRFDGEGYWCAMAFIPRAKTYETANPEYPNCAGGALGNFQAMLADIPEALGETVPGFHNTEFRLKQLRDAVAANAARRVAEVQYYLDEIEKRTDEMCKAERLSREGKLSERVRCCDTKVNSMTFDEDGRVPCVINLDMVMPSFVFSDYGDFLRTGASTGDEDDKDLSRVGFNMGISRTSTRGYLKGVRSFLTPIEMENLPYVVVLFPYVQRVRFLVDYINGDAYYKIKYLKCNLVHIKAQFKLLRNVEGHALEMVAFINECLING